MAIVIGAALVIGAIAFLLLDRASRNIPDDAPVLTAEAKEYVRHLALAGVEMKAAESYLQQDLVEITGNITNNGDRVLRLVQVSCVFADPYGQPVFRDRQAIAGRRGGPVQPGETRAFRLAFDTVPDTWNRAMPQLVIAEIRFD